MHVISESNVMCRLLLVLMWQWDRWK